MKKLTIEETAEWLSEQNNFCILTHRRPDGDTFGSAAGLCRGLRSLGKTAVVLENPDATPKFAPLVEGLTVSAVPENATVVAVDVAAPNMLPKNFQGTVHLRVDHHEVGDSFSQQELVDGKAAATGELIYDILMAAWADLDEEMATALYTAVSTDTGCFRYANTTDHSFLVAAACAAAGAPIFQLNQKLFETVSLGRLRIQGYLVEHMHLLAGGKIAVGIITRALEQELGLKEDDLENLSSFLRTVEGVEMAATLRETQDGHTRLSVRAIPGLDAAAVCAVFSGGGHKGAAGGRLYLSPEKAAPLVEREMLKQVEP